MKKADISTLSLYQKATWKIQWVTSEPPGTVSTEHGQIHRSVEVPAARYQPWCNGNGRPQSCPPNTNLRTSEEQNEKSEHPVDALGVRLFGINKKPATCRRAGRLCMGQVKVLWALWAQQHLNAIYKAPMLFLCHKCCRAGWSALSSWCAKRAWSRIWFLYFLALAEGISKMWGEKENGSDRNQITDCLPEFGCGLLVIQTFLMCFLDSERADCPQRVEGVVSETWNPGALEVL